MNARFTLAGMTAAATLTLASGAHAETLYRLHDHADGNAAPPTYGLRLDELMDVTRGHDVFTYSFDVDGAEMWMRESDGTIEIFGTAFGGLQGRNGRMNGWVEIQFTYENVSEVPGDDDLWVLAGSDVNTGSIRGIDHDFDIELRDYAGGHRYTFRFGDMNDDRGHRGDPGLSGWGWLTHGLNSSYIGASDWLFTATVVPVPPALLLGLGGLGIGAIARRRFLRR